MARTKAILGTGARLADFLSASLLARVVPAEVVNAVLDAHGCNSQRVRSFPAVAGAYYCMALSLYPEAAYEEVFAAVSQGLAWAAGAAQPPRVTKSSISELRSKIGAAPLQELVDRCCVPLADAITHPHAFYAGLRLVAMLEPPGRRAGSSSCTTSACSRQASEQPLARFLGGYTVQGPLPSLVPALESHCQLCRQHAVLIQDSAHQSRRPGSRAPDSPAPSWLQQRSDRE